MIGLVICTLLICATVIICILGWKYLDERDDLSYQRWNALDTKISNIEELLEKKNGESFVFLRRKCYLCNRLFELCKALCVIAEDRSPNHYLLHFITH